MGLSLFTRSDAMTQEAPSLSVQSLGCQPGPGNGRWRCSFEVTNQGKATLQVLSTWLPHDQFFGERRSLEQPLLVEPGESAPLEVEVTFTGEPGVAVVNAFLIMQVECGSQPWRTFVRLLPTMQLDGTLSVICEAVTVQPVGFSAAPQAG